MQLHSLAIAIEGKSWSPAPEQEKQLKKLMKENVSLEVIVGYLGKFLDEFAAKLGV